MVELPDIVSRLVGIDAYARTESKGGTYHPVGIQLAFKVWIPKILRYKACLPFKLIFIFPMVFISSQSNIYLESYEILMF